LVINSFIYVVIFSFADEVGKLTMGESWCAAECGQNPSCSSYLWHPEGGDDGQGKDCIHLNKYQNDFMAEQLLLGKDKNDLELSEKQNVHG